MCYRVGGVEGGILIVRVGRKGVWEERLRPPNSGWKTVWSSLSLSTAIYAGACRVA